TYSGNSAFVSGFFFPGDTFTVTVPFGAIQDIAGNTFDGGQFHFNLAGPGFGGIVWVNPGWGVGVSLQAGDFPVDMTAWNPSSIASQAISLLSFGEVDMVGNTTSGPTYHLFGNLSISGGKPIGNVSEIDVAGTPDGVQHFLYSI